ncbi:MAG: autotransporter outer membrane beta-barrel domain-containing protein [Bradyrhizobium sp.]|nr:autotransporter outer membrane beta-barrel domain-containing protein [Bradyrhizobium sp.]
MRCSLGYSRTAKAGNGRWRAALMLAVGIVVVAGLASSAAHAQVVEGRRAPAPPTPAPSSVDSTLAAGATVTDLGSSFLERLGNQASHGFGDRLRNNPDGGGASEAIDTPLRFRTWGEAYGISTTTSAQGAFVGDHRQTYGGVAGLGATLAPGVNVGLSIDQGRTAIDVPQALQSASLDLTQFGFNASVDKGPWTWAMALVHGVGKINSSRDTGFGLATAGYTGQIDGALTELNYYWNVGQSRLVPKAGFEYVRASTGAFQETGGLNPVMAGGTTVDRSRILLGAEIGHYWIFDQKILDLSAYGKFVDNVAQNYGSILVSLGPESITLQGIGESQYGADVGAAASLSLTERTRLYINYDGKLRASMQSHQGIIGVEYRW